MATPKTQLEKATDAVRRAEANVRSAREALEIAQREAARKKLPEPEHDGAIVFFDKQFVGGGRIYSYAARKAAGSWYLTGSEGSRPLSWQSLLDFIDDGAVTGNTLRVVTNSRLIAGE